MNVPSAASRAMIARLIAFNTVSRDSNLGLIEWVRDYLQGFGAKFGGFTGLKFATFLQDGDAEVADLAGALLGGEKIPEFLFLKHGVGAGMELVEVDEVHAEGLE